MWTITRQCQWPTGDLIVEVSDGGLDYTNPDALVGKYSGEFETFSDPIEAVETAITIKRQWEKAEHKRIPLGIGATIGFTMPFEPTTIKDAKAWAKEKKAKLPKCDRCGEMLPEESWQNEDSQWTGFKYCSEYCAEESIETDES